MKSLVWFAGAVASTIIVAGCEKTPEGQTVAVVNGEEIALSELNAEVAAANLPPNVDKKAVMPDVVQRLVDRRLMAQVAEEQGIARTPQFLMEERRMREQLLLRMLTERQAQGIKAPDQKAIDAFIAENPNMFGNRVRYSVDQIQFDQPADPTILQGLEDDRTLAEVEQSLTALNIPFTRNRAAMDSASVPADLLRQIQALPPGEPFILPVGGRVVASVITGRQPVTAGGDQNRQIAAELIQRRQLSQALEKQLEAERKSAKVEYQSGYAPKQSKAGKGAAKGKEG
jgi:peptidyl-prolyl cis-trans isomerase C